MWKPIKHLLYRSDRKKKDAWRAASLRREIILKRIWPDGMWKLQPILSKTQEQMDEFARDILLDVFVYQVAQKQRKHVESLGRLYSSSFGDANLEEITEDWLPSKKAALELFVKEKWDIPLMQHIIEELEKVGRVRA